MKGYTKQQKLEMAAIASGVVIGINETAKKFDKWFRTNVICADDNCSLRECKYLRTKWDLFLKKVGK